MNPDLHNSFSFIKPYCDSVMRGPTPEKLSSLITQLPELKDDVLEEMHLYILFPLVTHLRSDKLKYKSELQRQMVDAMKIVLEKVTLNSTEVFFKYHTCLLYLIYDKANPGVVADVPEELKHSLIQCFTLLMLNMEAGPRVELFKTYVPLIAQTVFICVRVAKQDKLRALRLSAINCVLAYTATHPRLTKNYQIADKALEEAATDFIAGVLPGVLASLQEVASDVENPGHAVVTAALNAIHRVVCLAMGDKNLPRRRMVSDEDFSQLVRDKLSNTDVDKKLRDIPKKTPDWYKLAAAKLRIITDNIAALHTSDSVGVRRELALYCSRILFECSRTMQPSLGAAIDVLLSLSHDPYPEVQILCRASLDRHFKNASVDKNDTFDSLAERMQATLVALPRVLNNIGMESKLSALNLILGYVNILSLSGRLPLALAGRGAALVAALREAARLQPAAGLRQLAHDTGTTNLTSPDKPSPWCTLAHLDLASSASLRALCTALGDSSGGELIVDGLMDELDGPETLWLLNRIGSAPKMDPEVTKHIINKYIEDAMWNLPFEVVAGSAPINGETSTWEKDSVPGLFEGAIETRYTDISYATPRVAYAPPPGACRSPGEADGNMLAACLMAEGIGVFAEKLGADFQPYMLKTLFMVLERVGSKYSMLAAAGAQALSGMAAGAGGVGGLLRGNADYLTHQITTRLRKSWSSQAALRVLAVVMEHSDASALDCFHGLVSDVLVQSCDKYHGNDLSTYLQVFLTFVTCIKKWFPQTEEKKPEPPCTYCSVSLFQSTEEFVKANEEAEKLVEEESKKTAEEFFKEDQKRKEDEVLDYDDTVTEEKKPPPQHVTLTVTILKRCLNFVPSKRREEKLLAMKVLNEGLPILRDYEDELLPLVHQLWSPLVGRFAELDAPVSLRQALQLLVTVAALAKDFIKHRTVKEVLPNLFKFISKSARDSRLKDVGSHYRQTQAFKLQMSAMAALPSLAEDLVLQDEVLQEALACAAPYLSAKQPSPLQSLALEFFTHMLCYDFGATWGFFRGFCRNDGEVKAPQLPGLELEPFLGSPFEPAFEYSANVEKIFGVCMGPSHNMIVSEPFLWPILLAIFTRCKQHYRQSKDLPFPSKLLEVRCTLQRSCCSKEHGKK